MSTNLVSNIRSTNDDPILALREIELLDPTLDPGDAERFVAFLRDLATQSATFDIHRATDRIDSISGSSVSWTRHRFVLYPAYVERLRILPEELFNTEKAALGAPHLITTPPALIIRPGEWTLHSGILCPGPQHYRDNEPFWTSIVAGRASEFVGDQSHADTSGGLSFNILDIDPHSIAAGEVDLRPLVLHALAPSGASTDRDNLKAQAAIANAFWQTFWATGARRAERGSTFPVAFLPIDRTNPAEFEFPFGRRDIGNGRTLFGRTAILAWAIEALTSARVLRYDVVSRRFALAEPPASDDCRLPADDARLALDELNRCGFVDRFTGKNAEIFNSHPASGSDMVRIHRVVPYSGCAFLSEVVNETAALEACGKIQDFDGDILAATNSTFFLNFPEEYATLHSAMNDPVALLVEQGVTHQPRTLRRATFAIDEKGCALITADAENHLSGSEAANDALLPTEASAFVGCDRSFAENTWQRPADANQDAVGALVIGDAVVETFCTQAEIPANGITVNLPKEHAAMLGSGRCPRVWVSVPSIERRATRIRHAFAVGPLLIQDGQIVTLDQGREEFQSIVVKAPPSFEQTRELGRTQVPGEFLHCDKRGVPPTRFPYDWNRTRAPRTAIGVRGDGHILLVVVDGRADLPHSVGTTLAELARLMLNLGCTGAMNMDGGGSSVMFVNDPRAHDLSLRDDLRPGVVNLPSDLGGVERLLPVPLVICRHK